MGEGQHRDRRGGKAHKLISLTTAGKKDQIKTQEETAKMVREIQQFNPNYELKAMLGMAVIS